MDQTWRSLNRHFPDGRGLSTSGRPDIPLLHFEAIEVLLSAEVSDALAPISGPDVLGGGEPDT